MRTSSDIHLQEIKSPSIAARRKGAPRYDFDSILPSGSKLALQSRTHSFDHLVGLVDPKGKQGSSAGHSAGSSASSVANSPSDEPGVNIYEQLLAQHEYSSQQAILKKAAPDAVSGVIPEKDADSVGVPLTPEFSRSGITRSVRSTRSGAAGDSAEPPDATADSAAPPGELTVRNPPWNLFRYIVACSWVFSLGFSDGAPGALLPYIEIHYRIGYAVVSLIWLGNSLGFITIAFLSHYFNRRLGRHKMVTLGAALMIIMYTLVVITPPFPVVVVAFFFGGLGMATALSQLNIFISLLRDSHALLGYFHGTYGIGATIAPLVGTAMVTNGVLWSRYYTVLLGLTVMNTILMFVSYRRVAEDLAPWESGGAAAGGSDDASSATAGVVELHPNENVHDIISVYSRNHPEARRSAGGAAGGSAGGLDSDVRAALRDWRTWCISLFTMFYQGGEVALGGWIVTFLLDYRDGEAGSVGYVASGFWVGLTAGRFLLTTPCTWIGCRRSVLLLVAAVAALEVLTWLVPNVISAGVTVSLAGVFLGPIYPILITMAVRILPRKIQVVSLTIMTAFGSTGGALFPFLVGLISEARGAYVVHPVVLALLALMSGFWLALPNIERKNYHYNGPKLVKLWERMW